MSYSGLGVYQQQPPKRPSRAPLWIALAVVAVLVVGAGVTAIVVLNSGDGRAAEPTSTSTTSSAAEPDWQAVEDEKAGLTYELPPSWEAGGAGSSGRVKLSTTYVSRPFQCQGRSMIQAQAMAGSIVHEDPEQVATELVKRIAAGGYTVNNAPPEIGEPRVETGDGEVVRLSVEVTPKSANACYAPKATVSAVAMRNGSEVAVFVLNVAEGGPHVAEGPSDDDVERILGSVRQS
ncbi:hypothetical protein ADK67_38230 [Saccharothrix sp. NRRL B-16348]|uniref:hypothetical protein n=1 Tax=Saccharothrix sp. NRRL B-16348 TaxID=1415542 RepID=UPI0006AE85EE|nr:hypothetical protein [Saccharothrix sp. NRRL B-16348]KOX17413.1 hypothetical protein ADK67_38230 [Saccharothrix sp. NRRL B-16348]